MPAIRNGIFRRAGRTTCRSSTRSGCWSAVGLRAW